MHLLRSSVHTAGDNAMMFFLVDGHNFPHWVAAARPLEFQTINIMLIPCVMWGTYETLLPKTIFALGASFMPLDLIKLQRFKLNLIHTD